MCQDEPHQVVCRTSRQAVHKLEEFVDSQIDTMDTDIIHSNAESSGIMAELKVAASITV